MSELQDVLFNQMQFDLLQIFMDLEKLRKPKEPQGVNYHDVEKKYAETFMNDAGGTSPTTDAIGVLANTNAIEGITGNGQPFPASDRFRVTEYGRRMVEYWGKLPANERRAVEEKDKEVQVGKVEMQDLSGGRKGSPPSGKRAGTAAAPNAG